MNYPAGERPLGIAVGDFNDDGAQDLAVANSLSNDISILLDNGDGTFQAAVNCGAGIFPVSIAVGDFNQDGQQDLAVANADHLFADDPGKISILLGNGNGSFKPAVNYDTGTGPRGVAVGDLNGDGREDLAVTAGHYDTPSGKYSHNLTTGVATPYSGGTDGGGDN